MNILGINAAYHESAAALLVDGELVSFVEEERINRIKHAKKATPETPHVLPTGAIKECLAIAGLDFEQIDRFAFSFSKDGQLPDKGADDEYLTPEGWGTDEAEDLFHSRLRLVPQQLEELAGFNVSERLIWVDHHQAHAASAFLCSPFTEALVIVADGTGEIDTISAYIGRNNQMGKIYSLPYPHSPSLLWEKICKYLGFDENDACKLMGLAGYGNPENFKKAFNELAHIENGELRVNNSIARFRSDDCSALEELFGPARKPDDFIEMRHKDIAATLQQFTEELMVELARQLKNKFRINKLCLAGGGALNCVVNYQLQKQGPFNDLFVQPAAHDAGTALGSALHVWCGIEEQPRKFEMKHTYWGPQYNEAQIKLAIEKSGLTAQKVEDPAVTAAAMIAEGNVVGWFKGRMEAGPRALGNRSLLAHPGRSDMRDILNRKLKHREDFRPFASSVLADKAAEWFHIGKNSLPAEYMLETFPVKKKQQEKIPAVMHVDGTSCVQLVKAEVNNAFYRLIEEFERLTGIPIVLNTSLNDSEPVVMTPEHALSTFMKTGIDALFLENYLLLKQDQGND